MTLHAVLFYILAIITAASAVAVVLTQNIVRAATWLLFALAGTAGIFFLLGADFLGATQLLVYVGGTMVLVVFGVMLTAQGPFINMRISIAEWAVAVGVGLLLFSVLAISLMSVKPSADTSTIVKARHRGSDEDRPMTQSKHLGAALLGEHRIAPIADLTGTPEKKTRERTRMNYLLPFEIVSVHLLVVLIGAAYLARAKRRRGAAS